MTWRKKLSSDEGLTLMELVVYSILSVGVLLIVGTLLINGLRGQASVTAITDATNEGQLAASSIQADIRNSSRIKVTAVSSDQFVVARVARGNSNTVTWTCVAWYYSASKKQIRSTSSSSAITAPSAAALANWRLVADGVQPVGTTPVFAATNNAQLQMSFTVNAGSTKPVPITSSASSRNPTLESAPCF